MTSLDDHTRRYIHILIDEQRVYSATAARHCCGSLSGLRLPSLDHASNAATIRRRTECSVRSSGRQQRVVRWAKAASSVTSGRNRRRRDIPRISSDLIGHQVDTLTGQSSLSTEDTPRRKDTGEASGHRPSKTKLIKPPSRSERLGGRHLFASSGDAELTGRAGVSRTVMAGEVRQHYPKPQAAPFQTPSLQNQQHQQYQTLQNQHCSRRSSCGGPGPSFCSQLKSRRGSSATTSSLEDFIGSRAATSALPNQSQSAVLTCSNNCSTGLACNGGSSINCSGGSSGSSVGVTSGINCAANHLQQQHNHHLCNGSQASSVTTREQGATASSGSQAALNANHNNMLPTSYDRDGLTMRRTALDARGTHRMARQEDGFTCSQQSILSAMDRFVKSVNNMSATVLVPSKLRDMDMPSAKESHVPPALANTDLYSFYLMLNDVKKELLWGPGTGVAAAATLVAGSSGRSSPRDSTSSLKQHVRQPSDDSLRSLGSTASSSDADTDSESIDSVLMSDRDTSSSTTGATADEHTSHLAAAFRHHLQGLHTILHQLAESANFLSSRYQEEIDASSL